ncbi:MAG: TetR/AcrR family transcriptional regulator [Gemmataceae bacterium]
MANLRRQPVQERGQQRIDRILDAADALFADVGYEQATTNAIAQHAGTSIGSLYQFFRDRRGVLEALAQRYRDRLHAMHETIFTETMARRPLEEIYDVVLRHLSDFHAQNRGFQPLFYGSSTSGELAQAGELVRRECITRIDGMLAVRLPQLEPARRELLATINFEVTRALLSLAARGDAHFREQILGEIKALLLGYMQQQLGPEPTEGTPCTG